VTEIVLEILPPDTVIVALLELVEVFAETLTVIEPLLVPEVGVTDAQPWLLLADHPTFAVMVTPCEPDPEPKLRLPVETSKDAGGVAPSCVMVIVSDNPLPLIVTVVLLELVEVFACAETLIEPLLLPEEGETLTHPAPLLALQPMLEFTVTL